MSDYYCVLVRSTVIKRLNKRHKIRKEFAGWQWVCRYQTRQRAYKRRDELREKYSNFEFVVLKESEAKIEHLAPEKWAGVM